ncbi:MAG: TolC family protein [Alphaproteobacteria bacterium]|nr:TolC family protein [Alphaproteobacteria bacterium]MCB9695842.1 TolC family protein [Alphaproteobacteria bacterium]
MIWWVWAGTAHAERPVTYTEALDAAAGNAIGVVDARLLRDRAEAAVRASQGRFDPLYTLDASTSRSRTQGFFQGFPYTNLRRAWVVSNNLSGSAGTGTSYSVDFSVDRNISEFTTDLGAGPTTQLQDAYRSDVSVSVTQQLLKGIRFRYNTQNVVAARNALTAAELTVEQQRQGVLYDAASAYWSWVYAVELRDNAQEALSVAEEALRVGRLQVERGQLAPVEATRLEAALVQARQAALDTDVSAEQAADKVLLLMGESPDQVVLPATEAGDVPSFDLDPERAAAVARESNLDLRVARQQLDTARIQLANSKHATLPTLSATGATGVGSQRCPPGTTNADCTVGNTLDAIGGLLQDDNQPFWTVGGTFSVPLGNRSAAGQRDQAAADVARAERQLADLERVVDGQVQSQVRVLSSARQRTELADANLRLAEETLKAEEALAAAGRSIQKDVLEARTNVERAKAEAAKARTDYRLAQARLLQLQGQLQIE